MLPTLLLLILAGCPTEPPVDASAPTEPAVESVPATPAPATPAPDAPTGALRVTINDRVVVQPPGGEPVDLGALPLGEAFVGESGFTPLFDAAKAEADRQAANTGHLRLADVQIDPLSPITRQELVLVMRTLAMAQYTEMGLWLGDKGPLRPSVPTMADPSLGPGPAHVGSAFVLQHRDVSTAWATASATWTETEGFLAKPLKGHRAPIKVPLAGDQGCHLLKPGPSRNLGPGIHARLTTMGVTTDTTLLLAATPHTSVPHELELALDLQDRGWTIIQVGSKHADAPTECPDVARTAADLIAGRDRMLAQPPAK